MAVDAFLDSDILVFAVSSAPAEQSKRLITEKLIANLEFGLSAQVLQEFYTAVTSKIVTPIAHEDALDWLDDLSELECVPMDAELVADGVRMASTFGTSPLTGAIIAAAQRLEAPALYTQQLTHGKAYGSVMAIDPFVLHSEEAGH